MTTYKTTFYETIKHEIYIKGLDKDTAEEVAESIYYDGENRLTI